MGYYVDLHKFSLDELKEILQSTELIPSWKILEENIDTNFKTLKKLGISNLEKLLKTLKDKEDIKVFSEKSKISEKYLQVLNRVAKGYIQKPNKLSDFENISRETVAKLEEHGFKNTLKIYQYILTKQDREKLTTDTGINKEEIIKIAKLTDLSRIRWVNHTFAYVLYETGFDLAEKVSKADPEKLYEVIKKLNDVRKIYNAHISIRDMKMCIDSAKLLEFEIEL